MAKSDAEITLKVNMPPPNDFKRALATAQKMQKEMADTWQSFGKDVSAQAEYAKKIIQSTEGTRFKSGLVKEFNATAHSVLPAESMITGGKIKTAGKNINSIAEAVGKGELTEAEGVEKLREVYKLLKGEKEYLIELEQKYNELVYVNEGASVVMEAVEGTRAQIAEGEKLLGVMKAQEDEYLRLAQQEREYREGLDKTSETYAQEVAVARQREVYYKRAAAAQAREAKGLAEKVESTREVLNVEKDELKVNEAKEGLEERVSAAKEKSLKISDDVQVRYAQWAAADENAANAREAAAKREEELAVQKEEREAQMAARERERAEQEAFNMEISLLNKEQLIKKLRELQKAREESAKAGDKENYAKRTREFMAAREQMEKLNTQLNLTRIAWTQQTQMANQFAGAMGQTVEGLESFSQDAEEGQMDLAGLMGTAQETGAAFVSMLQNGMSFLAGLQLAAQLFQLVWNKTIEKQKEANRIFEEAEALHDHYRESVKKNREELELFERRQEAAKGLKVQVELHKELKEQLEGELEVMEAQQRSAIALIALQQGESEHKFAMQKDELNRRFIRGEVTREQYEEELAVLNREREIAKAGESVTSAELELKAAEEAEEAIERAHPALAKASTKYSDFARKKKFGANKDEVEIRLAQMERAVADAEKIWAKYETRKEEGAGKMELDNLAFEYNNMWEVAYDAAEPMQEELERYFGKKIKHKDLPHYLRLYMADMQAFDDAAAEAKAAEAENNERLEAARDRVAEASESLENAKGSAAQRVRHANERYESGKQTREASSAATKKREKQENQLEDMRNKANALTEEELRLRLETARRGVKEARGETERAFFKGQVKVYKGELKGRRKGERAALEAARLENDLKEGRRERAAFKQLNLQGVLDTMDDGVLSMGEVRMLVRQLKLARQADNAAAQELIMSIVQEALASKKMQAEHKRQVQKIFEK